MSAPVNGFGDSVATASTAIRTIPFDYVFRFDGPNNELKGQPGLVHNSTVEISIEAAFTAVSIGYGVVPKVEPITFGLPPAATARGSIFAATLGELVVSLSEKLDELEFVNDREDRAAHRCGVEGRAAGSTRNLPSAFF